MITINNPTLEEEEEINMIDSEELDIHDINYFVWQYEKVDTLHIQGYVEFTKQKRLSAIKKIFGKRGHYEPRRGTQQQAIKYCKKERTRYDGPFEYGTPKSQGTRNDLIQLKQAIDDGLNDDELISTYISAYARYPKLIEKFKALRNKRTAKRQYKENFDRQVIEIVGEPGTGKTRMVYDNHDIDDIYVLAMGTGTNGSVWFDDYQGEKIILIDDFYGNMRYSFLLRLLDIYPIRVQTKGGYTYLAWEKIYITSNESHDQWYQNIDDISALDRRINKTILK